jgi:energy-coupling factor transporter transmembrane protein EcfT
MKKYLFNFFNFIFLSLGLNFFYFKNFLFYFSESNNKELFFIDNLLNNIFFYNTGFGIEFMLLILILSTLIPVLLTVAFFTVLERKILASVQRRRGPNVVGF